MTLGLLHGSAPHTMVLCHQAGKTAIEEPPYSSLPPLGYMRDVYESTAATVRPARVACVAVNCRDLDDAAAQRALDEIEDELGLPAADVFRGGGPKLWDAVAKELAQEP